MTVQTFKTCYEHPACVARETDGVVEHLPSDERPGVSSPPSTLTNLSASEADRLWATMQALQADLNAMNSRVESVRSAKPELRANIHAAEAQRLWEALDAVQTDVSTLSQRIENERRRPPELEGIRADVKSLQAFHTELAAEAERLTTRIVTKKSLNTLVDRIRAAEWAVLNAEAPAKPRELEAVRKALGNRIDELSGRVDKHADRDDLDALERRLSAVALRVEELSLIDKPTADIAVLEAIYDIRRVLELHADDLSKLKDGREA